VILLTSEETSPRKHTTRLLPCYATRVKGLREVFGLQASKLICARNSAIEPECLFRATGIGRALSSMLCRTAVAVTTPRGEVRCSWRVLCPLVCNFGRIYASGHTVPCSYLRLTRPWHRGQPFYLQHRLKLLWHTQGRMAEAHIRLCLQKTCRYCMYSTRMPADP
jgi:hypothetical protein